jgi:hypothetical protein
MSERDDEGVVWGAAAIGAEIGLTARQTWHQLSRGRLPAFKMGGKWGATRGALRKRVQPKGFGSSDEGA